MEELTKKAHEIGKQEFENGNPMIPVLSSQLQAIIDEIGSEWTDEQCKKRRKLYKSFSLGWNAAQDERFFSQQAPPVAS